MITIYQKTIKDTKLKQLEDFKVGSWLCVEEPTEEEISYLAKEFKLEEGLLKDAIDPYEVPRLEIEDGITYMFTRVPYAKGVDIATLPVLVAMGENFLVTISRKPLPFLSKFTEGHIDFSTTQKMKLFLQIFFEITASYSALLTGINRSVRRLRVRMEKISNKDIMQFVVFEEVINDFLAALVPTHTILKNLLSGKYLKLYEQDEDLVEDLFLSNGQLIESCKSNLKTIVNIREAYSTIMTNNLNRVIKLLTVLTIVLTIPTIVSSFYGMNVRLPYSDSPHAFWVVAGTTIVVSGGLLLLFRRNRWL